MDSDSKTTFPYSKNVLNMPKGPERKAAQSRERAKAYYLRTRKVKSEPKSKMTRKSPNKQNLSINNLPVEETKSSSTLINNHENIVFSDPIPLEPFLEKARINFPTATPRTIYGEACEIFTENYLPCKQCNNKSWIKARKNQKAYDLICKVCNTKYQIKGAKLSPIKNKKQTCEIICGRFPGVFECQKNGLDYYLFTYTDTHIKNIHYVNHKGICAESNLHKRSVKVKHWKTAKNYCTIKISKDKCEQLM